MRIFFTAALAIILPCCSSTPTTNSTPPISNQSATYQAPKKYSQHRTQQHTFKTDSGTYAYTDHGSSSAKETLVMIHGVPTSSWMYRKLIPELQQKHRIITIDLLGFGSSSKPKNDGKNYTPQAQAKNIRSLLKSIDVNNYTLAMHDMGGLVSWEILHQDSKPIRNLIIFNTIVTKEGFKHPSMKQGNLTKIVTNAFSKTLSAPLILKSVFHHMGLTGANTLHYRSCEGYVIPLKEGSNEALYAFFTSLDDTLYERLDSYQPTLNKFKGRSLVLWGKNDKNLTIEQIPYLQKHLHIPEENIHIYPKGSHLLAEEMPEEIIRQINQFLE